MSPYLAGQFRYFSYHVIGVLLVLGCGFASYWFGFKPMQSVMDEVQLANSKYEFLVANQPAMEVRLKDVTRKIDAKREQLETQPKLATDQNLSLIEILSELLENRHLQLSNLSEEQRPNGITAISLQVTGAYGELLLLLYELRQLDRPARITALNLGATNAAGDQCQARLSLVFASPEAAAVRNDNYKSM